MVNAQRVYEDFYPKVCAYVRGKIQDPHEAEDLVSAVFLKVMRKLDSYDPAKASLSTWVYTITRNTVTDFFRTRRSMVEFADWMGGEEPAPDLTDDTLEALADALLTLKERERDLIVLHYHMGHTLKVVAEMMGMSYANVKLVHKKALAGLRMYLMSAEQ